MKMFNKALVLSAVALSALALAQVGRFELRANLAGTGKGKVVWKVRDERGQMQAELEGEGERVAPAGTALSVQIGGNTPFAVTTNTFGGWRLSQRFTGATRPSVAAGDSVTVSNGQGVIVQSGTLQLQ